MKNMGNTAGELAGGGIVVDFSKWNGSVDYVELLKNNPKIVKVIARAAEGDKNADPMFATHSNECKKYSLPFEAYHFCTWNTSDEVADATSEASFLIMRLNVARCSKNIRIWVDTESNKSNIILSREEMGEYLDTFIATLISAGYTNYGIYGGKGFISAHYPLNHKYGSLPLWVASYNGKDKPTMPPGWNTYELWQYTDAGQVKGVKTRCDLNRLK